MIHWKISLSVVFCLIFIISVGNTAVLNSDKDYVVYCLSCHYKFTSKELGTMYPREQQINDYMHKTCAMKENVTKCLPGVSTCVTDLSEESFRSVYTDKDHTDTFYIASHYCGDEGNRETGCEENTGRTQGYAYHCVCAGTGCNSVMNRAVVDHVPSLVLSTLCTAAMALLIN